MTVHSPHHTAPWLTVAEFAAEAGIGQRAARIALSRALDGAPWRGSRLIVRAVPSPGGRRGIAYQVRADSLPGASFVTPDLHLPDPAPPPSGSVAAFRYDIIRPALGHPRGSAERRRAMEAAAEVVRDHPGGRRARVSVATLKRWIAAHERGGYAGIIPAPRADRGRRAVAITRAWDTAVPFDDATKARIAADLEHYVRSLWATTTEAGWKKIARFASARLVKLTEGAGFTADRGRLKAICKLSHHFVVRQRRYRAVAIHDQDAKQWHDRHRGRIRRTCEGRAPMEIVAGDVHPMDVLLPRPDGSTFTAKLIAFHDLATNRVFAHPVFLPKGEGVRQEHVIEALIAMTQDHRWGVPQVLYLDNGGEYGCLDLVADAFRLTTEVRALQDDTEFREDLLNRRSAIVRALPYNASAKAIEGVFGSLEKGVFSMLPGWIGGNRMAKKTANVGRAPAPYPHGEAAFRDDLRNALAVYETHPQEGALAGRSPREAYEAAVAAGWRRMDISRGALMAAFGRDDSRKLVQGKFRFGGEWYTAPELQALPAGTALHLRIPLCGDRSEIPVMDGKSLLCMAAVDKPFDVLDPEGAREAGRRHTRARAGVESLRADTGPVDMREVLAELAADEGPGATPESAGTIRLGEGFEAIGRALERPRAERQALKDEEHRISEWEAHEARLRILGKARAAG